jgi:hypothetical protein
MFSIKRILQICKQALVQWQSRLSVWFPSEQTNKQTNNCCRLLNHPSALSFMY